jgi:hypothetical protein
VAQSPPADHFGNVQDSGINSPSKTIYRINVYSAWVGIDWRQSFFPVNDKQISYRF